MRIDGAKIRKVREQLGEDQTVFGTRFGVHRRTIIRWEKAGNYFSGYLSWGSRGGQSRFASWKAAEALAELPRAKAAKKKSLRKSVRPSRKRARKAAVVKRRRGRVVRRRSAARRKK